MSLRRHSAYRADDSFEPDALPNDDPDPWQDGETPVEDVPVDASPTGYNHLARRAEQYLEAHDGQASEGALIVHVFGVRGKPEIWGGTLNGILARDSRFSHQPNGNWALTTYTAASRPLRDLDYVVLDVETTGLHPQRNRVIEVGAIRVKNGQRVATYETLLNPRRRLPDYITSLTNITQAIVSAPGVPGFGGISDTLLEFLRGAVIVGHNVGFDMRFLDYEYYRLSRPPLTNESIDTISLALRLHPGMRRPNLDRLAALVGLPVGRRHRAMADADLTCDAFHILLDQAIEAGFETLGDLRAGRPSKPPKDRRDYYDERRGKSWPTQPSVASMTERGPTARQVMSPQLVDGLPEKPGVYIMRERTGTIIYIGKAKSLRDRVRSYYSEPLGYTRKMEGLSEAVTKIDHIVTGSELEALLLESRLIKEHQPRYNAQLRNYENYPFIKVDLRQRFPRVYSSRAIQPDGARYFGPFKNARAVETTLELIGQLFPIRTCTRSFEPETFNLKKQKPPCLRMGMGRCPGPCTGKVADDDHAAYMQTIQAVVDFLSGDKDTMLHTLRQKMSHAAENLDFEKAAKLRDAYRQVERVVKSQAVLAAAVERHNLLIVLPSAQASCAEALFIYGGRMAKQVRLGCDGQTPLPHELQAIWAEMAAQADAQAAQNLARWGKRNDGATVEQVMVDEINIIARWIYQNSNDPSILPVPIAAPDTDLTHFWTDAVARITQVAQGRFSTQEAQRYGDVEAPA